MTSDFGQEWDLGQMRGRWFDREVHASATAPVNYGKGSLDPTLRVVKTWVNGAGEWVAFAEGNGLGEHHRASSMEALERRLQSLAVRREGCDPCHALENTSPPGASSD
jgi:hypothetical protein